MKNINEWELDNIDNDKIKEDKLLEMATQYCNNYGEEGFSCSSSEPGTESDNDNRNLSSTSEWTLHGEEDRATYNELRKLEEKIKDLITMYDADPEGNKHMRAFF